MKTQNFFTQDDKPVTFDDSLLLKNESLLKASDTADSDPRRQGVEIRTQSHYVAGNVKILSGERGHAVSAQAFGQGNSDNNVVFTPWADAGRVDPVSYVRLSGWQTPFSVTDGVMTRHAIDGCIDVTGTRHSTSTIEIVERQYRGFRGTLSDGNETHDLDSDAVKTVDEFGAKNASVAFYDGDDRDTTVKKSVNKSETSSYFDSDDVSYALFNKEFWPSEAPVSIDVSVVTIIKKNSIRSDTYVQSWQRSACAGFQYSSPQGTDSVAFGEMTYR